NLSNSYSKKTGLANFLKAKVNNDEVEILTGQESFILLSYAEANALVYLPQEISTVSPGDQVEVHMLGEFKAL
ncbi:MAG: hypothetical protein ACK4ND_16115, partial [Cytophagaceae bacterium]